MDDNTTNLIKAIQQYIFDNYSFYDIFLFVDDIINEPTDCAALSSFYMRFYKGSLVFTNLEDYLSNQDKILSTNIFIISSAEQLIEYNESKLKLQKNTKLLQYKDNRINEV